jgi:hypothetical protein
MSNTRHGLTLSRVDDNTQMILKDDQPIAKASRKSAYHWKVTSVSEVMPAEFDIRHGMLLSPRGCLAYVGDVLDAVAVARRAATTGEGKEAVAQAC